MTSRGTKSHSFLTGFTLPDWGFWFAEHSLSRCEPTLLKSSPYNIYRVNEKLLFLLQAYCSVMTLVSIQAMLFDLKRQQNSLRKMWSELNWPGSKETSLWRLRLYSCKAFSRVPILHLFACCNVSKSQHVALYKSPWFSLTHGHDCRLGLPLHSCLWNRNCWNHM